MVKLVAMLVFIDESGDPGFKIEKGSSPIFVIVCVIFDDDLEAEKTAVVIKELRRKLKFSDKTEFKFSGSRQQVRKEFLKAIKPFSFRIRALVVHKKIVRSQQLRTNKQSFYSYFIKMVLKHSGGTIKNTKIRIDGSGDRIFRKRFLMYLRRELNFRERKVMKNVKLINSRGNVLIQMADMIAGTIRRYKEGEKKDSILYWKLIKSKMDDCWDFK